MRQVVEARDIQVLFWKSKEFSYKLLQKIRNKLHKSSRHPISSDAFDTYFYLKPLGIAKRMQQNYALKKEKKEALPQKTTKAEEIKDLLIKSTEPYSFARKTW